MVDWRRRVKKYRHHKHSNLTLAAGPRHHLRRRNCFIMVDSVWWCVRRNRGMPVRMLSHQERTSGLIAFLPCRTAHSNGDGDGGDDGLVLIPVASWGAVLQCPSRPDPQHYKLTIFPGMRPTLGHYIYLLKMVGMYVRVPRVPRPTGQLASIVHIVVARYTSSPCKRGCIFTCPGSRGVLQCILI